MCGQSLAHPSLTLGFVGFGRIAHAALDRILPFTSRTHPPRVLYSSSRRRPNQAELDAAHSRRWGIRVERADNDALARNADVVIVLCSLTPATAGIIDARFLSQMKPSAVLINAARVRCGGCGRPARGLSPVSLFADRLQGAHVNNADLLAALEEGRIYGAGLDVIAGEPNIGPDDGLVRHSRCVVIPHMGNADMDTRLAMADLCARNAIAGARGEALPAQVVVVE